MFSRGEVGGGEAEWNRWRGLRGYLPWWALVIYRIVASLYCTPETNVTLYINYTGIKI